MSWQAYVESRLLGRTQTSVATDAGVSQGTISRWKSGQQNADAQQAIAFAKATGDAPLRALVAAGILEEEDLEYRPVDPSLNELTDRELADAIYARLQKLRGEEGDGDGDAAPTTAGPLSPVPGPYDEDLDRLEDEREERPPYAGGVTLPSAARKNKE
ncbi:helix-turn-helix transcriptional regulator [Nocardioides sp. SOB77]|uniref:Helix-turn-helix transcriptional regulator n=1 Tax=Nocardioides oceani TaxID=3058369 RepID=A0ABT8FGZ6_9ACTN|nr:helix-turn-helix transcriptional regulator [Nocardioides oceani]MDN4173963.1 helix-turn-helix transcriptional regulator [Nocardioides oceani]